MPSPGEIALARSAAESLQDDTCTVVLRVRGPLDEATGKYTNVDTRVYPPIIDPDDEDEPTTGPCRVKQSAASRPDELNAAGQLLVETNYTLSLPMRTSGAVELNHVAIIATSRYNPAIIGAELRIAGPFDQTHASARRFPAERTS